MIRLPDTIYLYLKWITLVAIPAFTTCYVGLSAVWGWPYAEQIAKTSAIVCTLLGSLIGISTIAYNKENDDPVEEEEDEP